MSADNFYRALSDQTRLRALVLLHNQGELCVCELTHALGLSQPKVSRHLGLLRDTGVVSDHRAGQWVYYRLHPDLPPWAIQVLALTAEAVTSEQPYAADANALCSMPNRPGAACCA